MTLSKVKLGIGTEIWIGRGSGPTWEMVMGGSTITMPSQPADEIDVTTFQAPNFTRQTMPGLKSVSDWSLDLQYLPGESTDLLLSELSSLTGSGAHEVVLLRIIPNGGAAVTFQCYVNEYTISTSVAEAQMVAVTFKVMARVLTPNAPANTLLPAISGLPQVGQTLTAMVGAWSNIPTFAYQWQEDDGVGYADIAGEVADTMVVSAGSVGFPIQVVVTGTNEAGSAVATSAPTALVVA